MHCGSRIRQSRREAIDRSPRVWKARRTDIHITVSTVPGIRLGSNIVRAVVACVVVFEEAEEAHEALAFAKGDVSAIRDKMLVQGARGVEGLALRGRSRLG